MVRHHQVGAVLLPATVIVALLLAATAATYEVVRIHDRTVAAITAGGGAASGSRPPPESRRRHPRPRLSPVPNSAALPRPSLPPVPKAAKSRAASTATSPAGSTTESTEPSELSELTALLRRSKAVRTRLEATTRAVADCTLAPDLGLSRLNRVIQSRSELLTSVAATAVSQIPGGTQLRSEFVTALSYSLAADSEFASWLRAVAGDTCPVPTLSVSSFQAALSDSGLANGAKADFLRLWNPLAARFGQPEFSIGQI